MMNDEQQAKCVDMEEEHASVERKVLRKARIAYWLVLGVLLFVSYINVLLFLVNDAATAFYYAMFFTIGVTIFGGAIALIVGFVLSVYCLVQIRKLPYKFAVLVGWLSGTVVVGLSLLVVGVLAVLVACFAMLVKDIEVWVVFAVAIYCTIMLIPGIAVWLKGEEHLLGLDDE